MVLKTNSINVKELLKLYLGTNMVLTIANWNYFLEGTYHDMLSGLLRNVNLSFCVDEEWGESRVVSGTNFNYRHEPLVS